MSYTDGIGTDYLAHRILVSMTLDERSEIERHFGSSSENRETATSKQTLTNTTKRNVLYWIRSLAAPPANMRGERVG